MQDGLLQYALDVPFVQVGENFFHGHGQSWPQRKVQSVIGRRGLQFKIESAADSLAQSHPPRPVNPGSERSVNHKLHTAAFVEETLGDYLVLGGDDS